jgi:regulatory protein
MEAQKTIKITDEKTGLAKAEHFCAYQERSQHEVRNRLYEWGLWTDAVENIIITLIAGNFLNEERFAIKYAHSKFNQKGWGKIKIKQGLKLKKIPDGLLKKALQTIDGDDYLHMLEKILRKKGPTLYEKDPFKRRYKLQQYALARGFESDLIGDVLEMFENP